MTTVCPPKAAYGHCQLQTLVVWSGTYEVYVLLNAPNPSVESSIGTAMYQICPSKISLARLLSGTSLPQLPNVAPFTCPY